MEHHIPVIPDSRELIIKLILVKLILLVLRYQPIHYLCSSLRSSVRIDLTAT